MDTLTKFTKLVFLLWNILIHHAFASLNVRHVSNAITWLEASAKCGEKGLEDNEDKLKNSGIQIENEFWIGRAVYREITPWIEVFGCTLSTDKDFKVYKVESIGQCQNKCDVEKVFGYKYNMYKGLHINCVCFTKGVPTEPNSACKASSGFLIHRYYNGTIKDDLLDPGNCVTLCCGNCIGLQHDILVGRNCNTTDNKFVGRCTQFDENLQQWGQNYNNSRYFCWQKNKLLLPSSFCTSRTDFNGVRAWTNVFREKFDVEKYGLHQHPTVCYKGVLHKTGNETKEIAIYRGNCNGEVNWFICKNTNTVQHYTTAVSLHVTSFSRESSTETRSTSVGNALDTKPITVSLQQSTNRIITENFMKKDNNTNSYTGVIIGGTIGAFVLLIISAAIFVCRKKSIGIFKRKTKIKDNKEEFSQTPNYDLQSVKASHVEPISNQNYGITTNQSSTYAVVDKLKKSDQKLTNNDETYTDSSDGQYDQLNDIQKRKIILGGNLYDSHEGMRDQNDPTYDISKCSGSHEVTDVYDHSFLGTQNDGEYDYSSTYKSDLTNETEMYKTV